MAEILRSYCNALAQAVGAEDARRTASLLEMRLDRNPHGEALRSALGSLRRPPKVTQVPPEWKPVVESVIGAIQAELSGSIEQAYEREHQAVKDFMDIVREASTNWIIPTLHTLCKDVYRLVILARREINRRGDDGNAPLESLAETLRDVFAIARNHRHPPDQLAISKKWGALHIVVILIKIYFMLRQLRLCNGLLLAISRADFPPVDDFPLSTLVPFRYVTGKLAMVDDKSDKANEALSFALGHCPAHLVTNRRAIVTALIAVRLRMGLVARPRLLEKYRLEQYAPLLEAFRRGDAVRYRATMDVNRVFFARAGVYLWLERLLPIVYRNLFKRVHAIVGESRVDVAAFHRALQFIGDDRDEEDTECLLATLIHQKLIRAYIGHEAQKVIFAKTNPFPPLTG